MSDEIVKSAGCIVCRYAPAGELEVLLVGGTQSEPNYWGFPKGRQEPGEIIEATAVREVFEETGVQVELLALAGFTRYTFSTPDGMTHHKMVRFYLAYPVSVDPAGGDAEHREVGWLHFDQAHRQLTYAQDRSVLSSVQELVEKNPLFRSILQDGLTSAL